MQNLSSFVNIAKICQKYSFALSHNKFYTFSKLNAINWFIYLTYFLKRKQILQIIYKPASLLTTFETTLIIVIIEKGIRQNMSRAESWLDNTCAENFFEY